MREQPALTVHNPSFCRPDAAATVQDFTFGSYCTGFRRDRTHQGNLELKGRLAEVLLQHRLDGQSHATVKQRCGEAAVHRARRIEMRVSRHQRDEDTTSLCFRDVITQRSRDSVERQFAAGKAADKFEPCQLPSLRLTYSSVGFRRHQLLSGVWLTSVCSTTRSCAWPMVAGRR